LYRRQLDTFNSEGAATAVLFVVPGFSSAGDTGMTPVFDTSSFLRAISPAVDKAKSGGKTTDVKVQVTVLRTRQTPSPIEYQARPDGESFDSQVAERAADAAEMNKILEENGADAILGDRAERSKAMAKQQQNEEEVSALYAMINKKKAWMPWVDVEMTRALLRVWNQRAKHMSNDRRRELHDARTALDKMEAASDEAKEYVVKLLEPCDQSSPMGNQLANLQRLMPQDSAQHYGVVFGQRSNFFSQNPAYAPSGGGGGAGASGGVSAAGGGGSSVVSERVCASLEALVNLKGGSLPSSVSQGEINVIASWVEDGHMTNDFGTASPKEKLGE